MNRPLQQLAATTTTREDLEYLMETASKLKDERLKNCIAHLVGWATTNAQSLKHFALLRWKLWAWQVRAVYAKPLCV